MVPLKVPTPSVPKVTYTNPCEKEPPSYPPRESEVHLKVNVIIEALNDYVKKHYADSLHDTFRVAMHMLHRVAPHLYEHHKQMLQAKAIERNQ